jgi:hypothetical protein
MRMESPGTPRSRYPRGHHDRQPRGQPPALATPAHPLGLRGRRSCMLAGCSALGNSPAHGASPGCAAPPGLSDWQALCADAASKAMPTMMARTPVRRGHVRRRLRLPPVSSFIVSSSGSGGSSCLSPGWDRSSAVAQNGMRQCGNRKCHLAAPCELRSCAADSLRSGVTIELAGITCGRRSSEQTMRVLVARR